MVLLTLDKMLSNPLLQENIDTTRGLTFSLPSCNVANRWKNSEKEVVLTVNCLATLLIVTSPESWS